MVTKGIKKDDKRYTGLLEEKIRRLATKNLICYTDASMKEKNIAAQLLGKLGGRKTLKKLGKKHYSRMGKLSAEAKKRAVDKVAMDAVDNKR